MRRTKDQICCEILSLENELEVLTEVGASKDTITTKRQRLSQLKSALKKRKPDVIDAQVENMFRHHKRGTA